MARPDHDRLRLELLRVRATIQRVELRAAVVEFRSSTQSLRWLFSAAARGRGVGTGARREGINSLAGMAFALLRERPWLVSALFSVLGRRGPRRWLLLAAVAGLAAWLVRCVVAPAPTPRAGAD